MRQYIYLIILGILAIIAVSYFFNSNNRVYSPTDLLEDSFALKNIPPARETKITYENRGGLAVTVFAYEGRIKILTDPKVLPREIEAIVAENGGKIISQAPAVGIYLAQVPTGQEAKFISALLKEPAIENAFPNLALTENINIQIDNWEPSSHPIAHLGLAGKPYYMTMPAEPGGVFEMTDDPGKAASHGDVVRYFLSGKKYDLSEKNKCISNGQCLRMSFEDNSIKLITAIANNASENSLIFNLSFGARSNDLSEESIQEVKQNEISEYLNILSGQNFPGQDKTILVKSAGKGEGVDVTDVFNSRKISGHEGLNRLFIVGATDESGKIADYSDFSKNTKDIIYVPVKEKVKTGILTRDTVEGTSFAAPQIAYLINKIVENYPQLARQPEILKEILFDKAVVVRKKETIMRKNKAVDIEYYLIMDPYSPATLKNALILARKKLGLEIKTDAPTETRIPEPEPIPENDNPLKQKLFESPYPGDLLPSGPGIE